MWNCLSSIIFSYWTALLVVAIVWIYRWGTEFNKFFEKKGIPFVKPFPFCGNLLSVIRKQENFVDVIERIYLKHRNKRFFGFFELRSPILYINNAEIIKQITIKDFDHFVDHRSLLDEGGEPLFTRTLIALRGDEWRHMRSTLSPAFTGSKMRQMFQLISDCSQNAVKSLLAAKSDKSLDLDMKELCARITTDVIASAAFGITVDSVKDPDNEFFSNGQKIMNQKQGWLTGLKFFVLIKFPKFAKFFNIKLMPQAFTQFFRSIVMETMEYREKNDIIRPDMIHLLMEAKKGQLKHSKTEEKNDGFAAVQESAIDLTAPAKRAWADDDITAQCMLFFFAGFDTTANTICFASHELMENPDLQKKLYAEIADVREKLQGAPLTYDVLQKMKYLDMVVTECLRKWPPAFISERKCNKAYTIEDDDGRKITVNVDDVVMFPIYGLHHDPEYFPNPKKFDPERFNEENADKIQPFSYLPFGSGPRNCIGSRFALMEVKAVIFYLAEAFTFEIGSKTQVPLKLEPSFALKPDKGFFIKLKPRD